MTPTEMCVCRLSSSSRGWRNLEERLRRLKEQARRGSRTSSNPASSDPPRPRQQRRAEARAKAEEFLRAQCRRAAGASRSWPGAEPEDRSIRSSITIQTPVVVVAVGSQLMSVSPRQLRLRRARRPAKTAAHSESGPRTRCAPKPSSSPPGCSQPGARTRLSTTTANSARPISVFATSSTRSSRTPRARARTPSPPTVRPTTCPRSGPRCGPLPPTRASS